MIIVIGIVLSFVGLGFLCWLLFTLAVNALPVFAGVTAGFAAYRSGAGEIGAILVGLIAGAFTLAVGRIAIATMRSPFLRAAVALLFAVPAAVAGYHAALGLAQIGVPAEGWRQVFALLGAIAVGGTAWVRMALSASTESDRAMLPVRSLRSPWRRWPGTDERPLVTSVPMDCQTARRRLL